MDFEYVEVGTEEQLRRLYALNRALALSEGQGDLFVAEYAPYREAFLGSHPAAEGWLILAEGETVGFAILLRKFASYLATVTAYIEDLYLQEPWGERRHYRQVLKDLGERYRDKGASRIEIRMLKKGVLDPEILREAGFAPVRKWQVWRKEAKGEEQ